VWGAAVALLAADLAVEVGRSIVVERSLGVDTIALVAMVGSLAMNQELAGLVVGLMFSSGAALETIASRRARRELTALVQRAPKVAQLRVGDGLQEVPVERVQIGDVLVVRTGEVIPVDGTLVSPEAVVDTSTLSGEPLPVSVTCGMAVLSGAANAGSPFDVRADRPASESAYAALVRLVEQAQTQRAPLVRMADRYAGFFLPATLVVAAAAWILSGDPVRALAVVVVAIEQATAMQATVPFRPTPECYARVPSATTQITWPLATAPPGLTESSVTTPARCAVTSFSIFIASITQMIAPAATSSPSPTRTSSTVPCIGLTMKSAAWPLPAPAPRSKRLRPSAR
jgi:Cation transport ATPase